MPIPQKYLADFNENNIYHVFNRTNNKELLFNNDESRLFFMQRYYHYLSGLLDTFCWELLPNHFHLMVKIKGVEFIKQGILDHFRSFPRKEKKLISARKYLDDQINTSEYIEQQFKRFFQSYSQTYNIRNQRKGNLFYKSFKRILIDSDQQFTNTVVYIHANPVKHMLIKDFTKYPWSSWHELIQGGPTRLLRNELWNWFGGRKQFIRTHLEMAAYSYECETSIED